MTSSQKRAIDVVVIDGAGERWSVAAVAAPRTDGRWQGDLEFHDGRGTVLVAAAETTQSQAADVFYWAAGLGDAYFDGAMKRAVASTRPSPPVASSTVYSTPADPDARLAHLAAAEQHVLNAFKLARATRLSTKELFGRGPFSNADLVRAFEDLEKRWRYIVRQTEEGSDWIRLTSEGAEMLGLPHRDGEAVPIQPPKTLP
jgi:hypothetical protein